MANGRKNKYFIPHRAGVLIGYISGGIAIALGVMLLILYLGLTGAITLPSPENGTNYPVWLGFLFILYYASFTGMMTSLFLGTGMLTSPEIVLVIAVIFLIFGTLAVIGAYMGNKRKIGGTMCIVSSFGLAFSMPLFIALLMAGIMIYMGIQDQPEPKPVPQRKRVPASSKTSKKAKTVPVKKSAPKKETAKPAKAEKTETRVKEKEEKKFETQQPETEQEAEKVKDEKETPGQTVAEDKKDTERVEEKVDVGTESENKEMAESIGEHKETDEVPEKTENEADVESSELDENAVSDTTETKKRKNKNLNFISYTHPCSSTLQEILNLGVAP